MTKNFTCAETAKLVRQSLKEAFPGVKFSVRSSTYSGGTSIDVSWINGPNAVQVESITKGFRAAYFDGSIDYQGSIHHMMDGEQVRFGADYITSSRRYSDAAVERAIASVSRRYAGNFSKSGIVGLTVKQFRSGELYRVQLPELHWDGASSVQTMIHQALAKHADRLKVNPSKTAAKKFIIHDDGYSRSVGAGYSAVSVDV
ncbi:LPD29 domain-containing protein [Caballeronia sp. SBC2]|uniref:LPD29 domain-containing protein n=1 Tax=Caballeronia sp. SBC2 TaxID=2705547 RepID=UPI0013E208FA|nr:LPD29 domain-containing protein [Caballeronia sp. SBC2]QIE29810.1 Large polyvalent protein associated domain 29 [Caballeronia sp. SBC2]